MWCAALDFISHIFWLFARSGVPMVFGFLMISCCCQMVGVPPLVIVFMFVVVCKDWRAYDVWVSYDFVLLPNGWRAALGYCFYVFLF